MRDLDPPARRRSTARSSPGSCCAQAQQARPSAPSAAITSMGFRAEVSPLARWWRLWLPLSRSAKVHDRLNRRWPVTGWCASGGHQKLPRPGVSKRGRVGDASFRLERSFRKSSYSPRVAGGTISTGTWACCATLCDTEPSSSERNVETPRALRARWNPAGPHVSSERIAYQVLMVASAISAVASGPAVRDTPAPSILSSLTAFQQLALVVGRCERNRTLCGWLRWRSGSRRARTMALRREQGTSLKYSIARAEAPSGRSPNRAGSGRWRTSSATCAPRVPAPYRKARPVCGGAP